MMAALHSFRAAACGLILLGLWTPAAEAADVATASAGNAAVHFNRTQRFERPVDPIIGYRNAEGVVFLEASFDDLPEIARNEIDEALQQCPAGMTGRIKAYTYVSDWLRARGLSPNYVVDFSGLTSDAGAGCATRYSCNDSGCPLGTYSSYGYGHWRSDGVTRVVAWSVSNVSDAHASGVPNAATPPALAVFDLSQKCTASAQGVCHNYRIWGIGGGLSDYAMPD